jgi:hypothetical protein
MQRRGEDSTMTEMKRVGELEITEDVGFQRKEWRFERIGWAAMALLVLAALAGLLGPGPLSHATAGEEGSALWVGYERFAHRSAPTTLEIHAGPNTAQAGQLRLWLGRDVIAGNQVQSIQPEPQQVSTAGDRIVYTFAVDDPAREVVVFLRLEPTQYWRQQIELGIKGGPQAGFTQVLYP